MTIVYEYEKLPLADSTAPKALNQRTRSGSSISGENVLQDLEDAMMMLEFAGVKVDFCPENIIEAKEKYMIETQPMNAAVSQSPEALRSGMRQKGFRKPHYTKLLISDNCFIFQAACCLPLKIIAASFDGESVSGRTLFSSHSEEKGGKLVYEFTGSGREIIVDLKRGESTRAQRLIFRLNCTS
ncbi:MAG: hypothetical protein DWB56_05680 [Candidatus Jettenia sp.]|uniref:Uncharacterized protein n=1 Tax=Candidatus Jettenia caeni TaxID=247490 RepID=I3INP6_9BACT|nr:hypothetical protein [Candidatus Jettenia sp. AMX1]MBC6928445.1 hypothetical protein [Candidatus Jettenia sp.]WKZ15799.1 MAG: hypothetical protein QY317_00560 [Candidatus Jettenia caeni]KAA0250439.1 MAG: hypothetical protein EDM77_04870 [Candidatus Jettenia sp. AMX1]MCE7879626.1 hypothetical protein [Candidatus Jettenia sp. AMX1]MCQ3926494.1 hypothetical protein [Candidatus Jettenia sp.]